jgi:outer membrane protein TolC
VANALQHRAELVESRITLNTTDLSNKAVRNALLPSLDVFAYYGGAGLGGSQNPTNLCANQNPPIFGCSTAPVSEVGYSSTLNQLINSTASDKGVGIQLNIPLRNRAAQSTQIRSELEYQQAQMALQQAENKVNIEVRNAQFGVEQNRASVASAQAAVDYAKQSLDAEQKKYQFGTSTTTLVLQNRSALATAESTLVSAMAAYEKARVELDRAVGVTLDHAGISIDDAARGQVTRMPNVPYVAPRKDLPSNQPSSQPQ